MYTIGEREGGGLPSSSNTRKGARSKAKWGGRKVLEGGSGEVVKAKKK